MKKVLAIAFLLFSIGVSAQQKITDPVANAGWSNDANEVFQKAEAANQPVLMNFTGSDWCKWCFKIKDEIFDTPEFKAWVKENNIALLELDYPRNIQQSEALKAQNRALQQQVGVRGFPTIILLSKGKAIKAGYMAGGAEAWIKDVESRIEI